MGPLLSIGKGAVMRSSKKQKIQGHSSTGDEVIGVYNVLPQVIWTQHFVEAQDYSIDKNVVK